MENIVARLIARAEAQPDRMLLDAPDGVMTYHSFLRRSLSIAERLCGEGVRKGDRVAIYAKDYVSCLSGIFGCWLNGAVAVPLNLGQSKAQCAELVSVAEAKLVICQGGEGLPVNLPTIRYIELPSRTFTKDPLVSMNSADPALILFTSGTTGASKGACLTLGAISYNALLAANALKLTESDRIFLNTPPYYTSGLNHFLTLLTVGGSVVARGGFYFGEAMVEQMLRAKCTGFGGAPTHLIRLAETLAQGKLPAEIRFWTSSGDHLPAATAKKALRKFPLLKIYAMYGLTEVGGRLCILDAADLGHKTGSVGKPVPGMTVIVRDRAGREAKPFEVGEVCVRGPLLMTGYLGDSRAREEFRTGDYGYFDKDGFLWLKGRKDDLFKCGAEKVSCLQIQESILATGLVDDVAVVAVKDAFLGKIPHAYIVPGSRYDEGRLKAHLRRELSAAQMPKRFLIVDEIPRTGSGKVRVAELREERGPADAAL